MAKGDWVLPGTTLWVNNAIIATDPEGATITSVTISYSIILPSGTSLGYQHVYQLPQPLPQTQITQAISDAIAVTMALEGLPL